MNALLLLAVLVSAQDATIEKMQGAVSIRAGGEKKWVKARPGDSLIFGDGLRTGPGAAAHLVLKSGAAVLVKEGSTLVLTGHTDSARVRFNAGEFLIGLRRKLAKGRSFRVQTPSAVAAVRGTLFWGKVNADKSTDFAALENEIAVSAAKKTVVLKPGQRTSVAFGQAPSEPAAAGLPPDYPRTNFAIDGSLQGLEELLK